MAFQMKLERSEWGNDLPSVEAQLEAQRQVHSSVEGMGSSVKEARMYEVSRPTWAHLPHFKMALRTPAGKVGLCLSCFQSWVDFL